MTLQILPVTGLPVIARGDDLAGLVAGAIRLRDGDIVTIASKVVAKAEGAVVPVDPGADPDLERRRMAAAAASEIVADTPAVLIVRTVQGWVCANGGIDASNSDDRMLVLLPADADASARRLRERLRRITGAEVAVVVTDTFGRPWREGQTDVAIGVAGLKPLRDERGTADFMGHPLAVTTPALADEVAAAADLVRRKGDGVPAVVVRGLPWTPDDRATASDLVRSRDADLFRRGRGMLAAALTDPSWPSRWDRGATPAELEAVTAVAPGASVTSHGPPTAIVVADGVHAGLAAAVLADAGLRVRWRREADGITVEAGLPAHAR